MSQPSVRTEDFGTYDGQAIERYVAENHQGTIMAVMSYGATWQEFSVVENGQRRQLVYHFETLADYITKGYAVGKVIGRVAGRIKDAKFKLDDTEIYTDPNEEGNTLHGGTNGFGYLNFTGETFTTDTTAGVRLQRHIASALDHFPGDIDVTVTYTLTEDNEVQINFAAESSTDTLFNPTCHVYWNLTDGQKSIQHQYLQINGQERLILAEDKTPTGELTAVKETAYDFTHPRQLGSALQKLVEATGKKEFDDAYKVSASKDTPIAILGDEDNQRQIQIFSPRNGLVIYTANPGDADKEAAHDYDALATEAQVLPDAINNPKFGSIVLPQGVKAQTGIRYRYVVRED